MVLLKSFNYYLDNQEAFVAKYNGKVVVLVDTRLVGVYSSVSEAYHASLKEHIPGTFLIQKVSPGSTDTVTYSFTSRSLSLVGA